MSKINKKDLNLLLAFDLLMKLGSVSKAAQKMGVTQSAMSHILNRLRKEFDDVLLVKKGSKMVPTSRAEQLYSSIQQPLEQLKIALDSNASFEPRNSDLTFVFATTDYFEMLAMPYIMANLQQQAPLIKIRCRNIDDYQLSEIGRTVDFAFGHFKYAPNNLIRKTLWKDEFVCVASKDHPRIKEKLSLAEFVNERHILISPSGHGQSMMSKVLAQQGLKREISLATSHFSTPIHSIRHSELIATMPMRLVELYKSDLNSFEPPVKIDGFDMHILWDTVSHQSLAHKWMRNLISQAVSEV